jgi:hypothetical protein
VSDAIELEEAEVRRPFGGPRHRTLPAIPGKLALFNGGQLILTNRRLTLARMFDGKDSIGIAETVNRVRLNVWAC